MRSKAIALELRLWHGPAGEVRASVRPVEGKGEVIYFKDLESLCTYLKQAEERGFWIKPPEPPGLR